LGVMLGAAHHDVQQIGDMLVIMWASNPFAARGIYKC
jgi:hypothetical protein